MKRRASEDRIEKGLVATLIGLVAASVLLVGGISPWLYLPVAAVAIAAALVEQLRPAAGRPTRMLPVLTLGALAVYSAVQAVPLPVGVVKALSPVAADVWERCLLPLGETRTIASLSLAPDASLYEAAKWTSYAAVFLLAVRAARRYGAPTPLLGVFAVAVVVALVSMGHALAGAETVYGLYAPLRPIQPGHASPLLNPNNLAGYLNLSILVGAGLTLSRRPVTSRWLLGAGLIILLAVSLRTASRGGVASLAVGLAGFGLWATFARKAKFASARIVSYATSAALFVGAGFALLGADQAFWPSLLSENMEKLQLPVWSVPVIRDHTWFGIGRGAFTSVFFAYRPESPSNIDYTHPENVAVQWVTEWGVVVPTIAMALLVFALFSIRHALVRSAVLLGALFGMGTLFLQNLVDLGLEVPGVAVSFAAVFGAMWGGAPRAAAPTKPAATWALRGLLASGLVVAIAVLIRAPTSVDEDRVAVQRQLEALNGRADVDRARELRDRITELMVRHPADYYFPLAGAYTARLLGESPILWVQRALERGPTVGRTHLLLSEYLLARGFKSQGLLEMRLAIEYEPILGDAGATVLVRHASTLEEVLEAVPRDDRGFFALRVLAQRYGEAGREDLRRGLDLEALNRAPDDLIARVRVAEDLLAGVTGEKAPCLGSSRVKCMSTLAEHATELESRHPAAPESIRLRARVALLEGRNEEALDLLRKGCVAPEGRLACLQLLASELAKRGASEELSEVLDKVAATGCMQRSQCAEANRWVGSMHVSVGNRQQAVTWFERAARHEPTAARWLDLAEAARAAGLDHVVKQAVGEASSKRDAIEPANAARLATFAAAPR